MIYKEYDQLTVLKVQNGIEAVPFTTLVKIILEKPSNIIYCELDRRLYGIISMGDIARANDMKLKKVTINKRFTCLIAGEYMKARDIFSKNPKINALPVVGKKGELLGAYSRWEDLMFVEYMLKLEKDSNVVPRRIGNWVVLVRPCQAFTFKRDIFHRFWRYLLLKGISVKCIDYEDIADYIYDGEEWILFVDEDEMRAIDTLFSFILDKDFNRKRLSTYKKFILEADYEMLEIYLGKLQKRGVYVVNMFFSHNNVLQKRIVEKYRKKAKWFFAY